MRIPPGRHWRLLRICLADRGSRFGPHAKLRDIERDPRVVLSFDAPRQPGVFMNPYAVLRARAAAAPSDGTWDLLNRLAKVYVSPDTEFPAPRGPGYIVRYSVERMARLSPGVCAPQLPGVSALTITQCSIDTARP
jgi:hypothetical protein